VYINLQIYKWINSHSHADKHVKKSDRSARHKPITLSGRGRGEIKKNKKL